MRAQRSQLNESLREAVHADDVTKRLIAFQDDKRGREDADEKRAEFFRKELMKFEPQARQTHH